MTTVHTVVAYTEATAAKPKTIWFMGHYIAGSPCEYCAEETGRPERVSRCAHPKECALRTMARYDEEPYKVAHMEHGYRQKPGRQLYSKADFAVRTALGLHGA